MAYESLTKERRAALHERYAAWYAAQASPAPGVTAFHLEQAFRLRVSLTVPGEAERDLASRAMEALASVGELALDAGDRRGAADALSRAAEVAGLMPESLRPTEGSLRSAGHLAFRLGEWIPTVAFLELLEACEDLRTGYELGVALAQSYRREPHSPELSRARTLLEGVLDRAKGPQASDAASTLAGTWKGIDDDRAMSLYRRALDLDPGDPYALGNVVEYEVAAAGDRNVLAGMREQIAAAVDRCRSHIDDLTNLPWACFDLAKFSLLMGDADGAFLAACLAVDRSSAAFMVGTSLRSLEGLAAAADPPPGLEHVVTLYRLALAASFDDKASHEWVRTAARSDEPFDAPVVILAGGSSAEIEAHIRGYGDAVAQAMAGTGGTLVSGGTTQGVSAIAGDVASAGGGVRAVGYLPGTLPSEVQIDEDGGRYARLRGTDGRDFSVAEPLGYWTDLVALGVDPEDVRLLAIGGGRISAAEYRVALALGAHVGAIHGSGGAASDLLRDPGWATSARLTEVAADPEELRAFLR